MKIVFATGNEGKMVEIREILKDLPGEILSLKQLGIKAEAEETGKTFAENAEIKAREIYDKLKAKSQAEGKEPDFVVLADDSGLCVDYLHGEPGIYSARWLGHETPYEEKNRQLIQKLSEAGEGERGAQFVCAICGILPDGRALHTEGVIRGEIAREPQGENGFGYDPIFWLPEYGMTSGALPREKKNEISHRGKALAAMSRLLKAEGLFQETGF